MDVDAGTGFGLWADPTSRLIYTDAMPALLSGTDTGGRTLDLGGGNGLSRQWFADVTTVDSDPAKEPDVLADVVGYVPDTSFDRVLLRYVLHYLDDREVNALLAGLASWHYGQVTVIQFVNDDLPAKQHNSVNEHKHFRTEPQLAALLCRHWRITRRIAVEYDVDPDFYRNRLAHPCPTGHAEAVVGYTLERA